MGKQHRLRLNLDIEAGLHEAIGSPRRAYLRVGRTTIQLRDRHSTEKPSELFPDAGRPYWRRSGDRDLSVESRLPLPGGIMLQLSEKRRTYAEAVGYTPPSMDSILDMFDMNFDRMATASIRHHLTTAADPYRGVAGEQLQELHDRLTEPRPKVYETDEDHETKRLVDAHRDPADPLGMDLPPHIRERQDALFDRYRRRRWEWRHRRDQARHDFIDQMGRLR